MLSVEHLILPLLFHYLHLAFWFFFQAKFFFFCCHCHTPFLCGWMLPVYYDTHRRPHVLGPSHVPQLIDLEQFMNPLFIIDSLPFCFRFLQVVTYVKFQVCQKPCRLPLLLPTYLSHNVQVKCLGLSDRMQVSYLILQIFLWSIPWSVSVYTCLHIPFEHLLHWFWQDDSALWPLYIAQL